MINFFFQSEYGLIRLINSNFPLCLKFFPQWEEDIIDHIQTEPPIILKKFLNIMVKYLKMNESKYFPLKQANSLGVLDNEEIEFIDTILPTNAKSGNMTNYCSEWSKFTLYLENIFD